MTTTKPQVKIVNVETGEEIVRDATAAEIAQIKLDAENAVKLQEEVKAKAADREALLNRLGITADEAKLLLA
jgi:hypothetical protein